MLAICSYASAQDMKDMNKNKKDTVKPKTTSYYTCVMHPAVHKMLKYYLIKPLKK